MKVESFDDPEAFWAEISPVLAADPVRHNIAITVLAGLRSGGPAREDHRPALLSVRDNDSVTGFLIWTPPWPVVSTGLPAAAAPLVVEHLLSAGLRPGAANGARPEATALAEAWTAATGSEGMTAAFTELGASRLYRLAELVPPAGVPGAAALGTEADLGLLTRWTQEFAAEAQADGAERPRADREAVRRMFLTGGPAVLWRVAGQPVGMAGVTAPLAGMSRIATVYTPPEHRGHGYGSAVTAAAIAWAHTAGATEVVLFTDLANPTSNALYQRLGFHPVLDATTLTWP